VSSFLFPLLSPLHARVLCQLSLNVVYVWRSLPSARVAASQLRAGRALKTSVVPALRLSGGAAGLQAAVLDGIGAKDIDGKEVDLGKYSSIPAVLVVNLASA